MHRDATDSVSMRISSSFLLLPLSPFCTVESLHYHRPNIIIKSIYNVKPVVYRFDLFNLPKLKYAST